MVLKASLLFAEKQVLLREEKALENQKGRPEVLRFERG
jgi:hypothetical protein